MSKWTANKVQKIECTKNKNGLREGGRFFRVIEGARTPDPQNHNLML
jgi:hypothetical protein